MTETTQTMSGLSRPLPGGLGQKKCSGCGAPGVDQQHCWCRTDKAKE